MQKKIFKILGLKLLKNAQYVHKNLPRPRKIATKRVAGNLLGDSFRSIKVPFSVANLGFSQMGPPNSGGGGRANLSFV